MPGTSRRKESQREFEFAMAEMANYKPNKSYFPSLITNVGVDKYRQAYKKIQAMYRGDTKYNFKEAVFLIENAYFNNQLKYNWYLKQIDEKKKLVKKWMLKEKLDTSLSLSKNYAIQKLFTSTYTEKSTDGKVKVNPAIKYDFEDFMGRKNYTKMFVTKLLKSNTGQCHSMPQLTRIIAEEVGTKAYLAYAPEHLYIKFLDINGNTYNFETTNGMNTSEQFIYESGYVSTLAVKNHLYMDTLTQEKEFSLLLFDLASGYLTKHGIDEFLLEVIDCSIECDRSNIHAIELKAAVYTVLAERARQINKLNSPEAVKRNSEVRSYFDKRNSLYAQIDNSGYQKMSDEAYQAWLKSLDKEQVKKLSEEINKNINTQMKK